MAKRKPPAPVAEPTPAAPPTPSHGRPAEALYQESQRLDRPAPLTAAGTRIRQRDQLNEWIAYCMVILIFIMIGNLGERWWDMRTGRSRELPPELVAALERESAGGRMDTNPLTGAPRAPDDPARERELLDTLKQNPEDHDAMVALGNYYYDTLQVEKAIEQYTHYLEHNPDNVAVMTDLATMQFLQGMGTTVLPKDMDPNSGPVAAVATLNEAVEVDPTYAPAWQNLGWAYRQIGRTQE
ncbi:MAG TPA: tetratricopeptide repeat protein, partial [bacterium]|nr:tetratricopeptide repeat protein [bacterium]